MAVDCCFCLRMARRLLVAPFLLCIFATTLAFADEDFESNNLPIVLTASRIRQPLSEAPAAVTVIDREMIAHSGARQIVDLLRFVPGAIVGYNDGNWPTASLRGLSSAYASGLQVLIDGVSAYSPVFGGMLWAELPISIDDIERIEVVRGPNGASYGANSFQGVVNIITRDPATESGTQLIANAGAAGIRDATFRHAGSGESWNYRFTLGRRSDDGFNTRPDSMWLNYANLKTDYHVSNKDRVDFSLRATDKNKQIGQYASSDPTNTPHDQTGNRFEFQTRWSHAESTDDEWWIQFYHQEDSQRDRLLLDVRTLFPVLSGWPVSLPFEMEQDYKTWRDGIEFQKNSRWSNQLRSVWGTEVRRDAVRTGRYLGTSDEAASFLTRIFGNVEWTFAPQWILHTGAMYERNAYASNGWSPRIALIHEIGPGHTLRASVSSALRTPSLIEEKGNFRFDFPIPLPPFSVPLPLISGSGMVDSERVRSEEIGYVFNSATLPVNGEARLFSDRYSKLIVFRGRTATVGNDAVNSDVASIRGLDLSVNWKPIETTRIVLSLARSQAYSADSDAGRGYVASVPQNTVSLFVDQMLPNDLVFTVNYQHVSAMFWMDAGAKNHIPNVIPAIDHLNLRLAKRMRIGGKTLEVAGVVQNALGHYRDYYPGSALGTPDNVANRVVFLQVSASF